MRISLFVAISVCASSVAAAPPAIRNNYIVHERRIDHPSWTPTRRLEGHVLLPIRIGLRQQNLEDLPDLLMSVSDPTSPSFGQHWSPEKVADAFAPDPRTQAAVQGWLVDSGFKMERLRLSHNKAWIEVQNATVREVEQLLDTEYHAYTHTTAKQHIGCHSYSIPGHLQEHIDIITPTVHSTIEVSGTPAKGSLSDVSSRKRDLRRSLPTGILGCDEMVTPACLQSLYNITYTAQVKSNNSFAIVSHGGNSFLQSDLDTFFANFSPSSVGTAPLFVSVDGGTLDDVDETDHGENDWALEYAVTLVHPQEVTVLQVGDKDISAYEGGFPGFNEWLDAVDGSYCTFEGGDDLTFDPQFPNPRPGGFNDHSCGIIKPPNVVSISSADEEHRLTPFYTARQCHEYAKLGLMGVSILYGSGDTGVAGATTGYCLDKNGSVNPNATTFNPPWPGSCPWITSVGGTQVKANASTTDAEPEEVWNEALGLGFFTSSGGGFSNRFAAPGYQTHAVSTYLSYLRKRNPGLLAHFNTTGRGFPDLSINARQYVTVEDGELTTNSGVSGGTPVVGSLITLINDARLAIGKKPVGFINPVIYSPAFASAFRDITAGSNTGCKGLQGEQNGGFPAAPGWDPATGLGTPDLSVLLKLWVALP